MFEKVYFVLAFGLASLIHWAPASAQCPQCDELDRQLREVRDIATRADNLALENKMKIDGLFADQSEIKEKIVEHEVKLDRLRRVDDDTLSILSELKIATDRISAGRRCHLARGQPSASRSFDYGASVAICNADEVAVGAACSTQGGIAPTASLIDWPSPGNRAQVRCIRGYEHPHDTDVVTAWAVCCQ